ncbi:hypothetical protein [Sphaerisporangium corydalis]|uniref:ABC transporter permease n=1 Tax=Sphaerisporangium corydalis TaxID=1441875 RepID=A0ABV9E934_9ACTN|nr:hypothetical protein [Sphaerisporangium corydalis]
MRFPSRLLAANMAFALLLWAALVVLVAVVGAVIAINGSLTESAWEKAAQVPRWYALFVGVALVREYLPMYIAHGQTRRQFGAQGAVTVALFAPFLALLLVLGYLLETGIYALAGLEQALGQVHLFTDPGQLPVVFTEYLVEFLAWIVAGAFMGAGFYRWREGGVFTIPVGVGLVLLAESTVGPGLRLPFLLGRLGRLGLDLPKSPAVALAIGLAVLLAGLALTWSIIRDVPLRNRWS